MGAAADGHIINGGQCRLFGVYHLQVLDPALAQLGAHYAGQRADGGIVNIRNFQGGSIQLVARAHAADDGRARCLRLHDQFQLALYRVDGIDHVVVLAEIELVGGVWHVERLVGVHHGVRVDIMDALFRHIHLVFAHRFAGGQDLAVQVGQADLVVINQVQRANAAACQCFHRIASNTANAKHGHTGVVQTLHCLFAKQQLRS